MLLDLEQPPVDRLPLAGLAPTNPRTGAERFSLEFDAFVKSSQSFSEEIQLYKAYEAAGEKLYRATGQRFANPMTLPEEQAQADMAMFLVGAGGQTRSQAVARFKEEVNKARAAGHADLPDADSIESDAYAKIKAVHDEAFNAGLVSSPWTGPAAFAGVMAGALTDPINLATLPFGASARLSGTVAMRTLQAMAQEGAIAAGSQALIEMKTAGLQEKAGIEGSPIESILAAGIGGGLLAGGIRGLREAFSARAARGLGMTLDEMDALVVADRYGLDLSPSAIPKGVDAETHLDAANAAYARMARSEPITQESLMRTTALKTSIDPDFVNGPAARREIIRKAAAQKIAAVERVDAPEVHAADLLEAQRIAAGPDLEIAYEGRTVKASDLLQEASEQRRVAEAIASACLGGGA
mgnify:FL=1